jgi:hypothetical protein
MLDWCHKGLVPLGTSSASCLPMLQRRPRTQDWAGFGAMPRLAQRWQRSAQNFCRAARGQRGTKSANTCPWRRQHRRRTQTLRGFGTMPQDHTPRAPQPRARVVGVSASTRTCFAPVASSFSLAQFSLWSPAAETRLSGSFQSIRDLSTADSATHVNAGLWLQAPTTSGVEERRQRPLVWSVRRSNVNCSLPIRM